MAHFRELPEDEGGITCMVVDDKNVGSIFSGFEIGLLCHRFEPH